MLENNNIKFYHLDLNLEINQEISIGDLNSPGIFAIECLVTKRVFFVGAENTLLEISIFFENLVKEKINNIALVRDFKMYGKKSFKIYILEASLYLETGVTRELELKRYQELYSDKIY